MRAPLTFPAALVVALLAAAPAASALTLQTSRTPDGINLTDPDSNAPVNPQGRSFLSQQSEDSGTTMHIGGATLHFGLQRRRIELRRQPVVPRQPRLADGAVADAMTR